MRRRQDVVWRLAPGFLALTRHGQDVTVVQGPAAHLWELIGDETSLDTVAKLLAERHDASAVQVRHDIEGLVRLLHDKGYVEADDVVE